MKTVQKRQIQLIMLLSAVILILLCGVLVTVKRNAATPASGSAPYVHSLVRDARPSANPLLEYETNIGGTGSETPVSVLSRDGLIYVFGNTDSSDLDLAANQAGKTQGFCATLTENGHTASYTVFPFTFAKVIPISGGFAAAGNRGNAAGLYLLSSDLTVTGEATMPTTTPLFARALYVYEDRYFLLAESEDTRTNVTSLLLQTYTKGLALEHTKVIKDTYSLSFIDLLPTDTGYVLAACASFQTHSHLLIARFTLLGNPSSKAFDLGYYYTPYSFTPTATGYAALSAREGKTEMLTMTDSFEKTGVRFLSEDTNEQKKSLFYAGGLYAHTGDTLFRLDDDGKTLDSLPFAASNIDSFLTDTVASFCAGFSPDSSLLSLAYLGSTSKSETIRAKGKNAILCKSGNRLLVCAAVTGGQDVGRVFGESDIWLCAVSFA